MDFVFILSEGHRNQWIFMLFFNRKGIIMKEIILGIIIILMLLFIWCCYIVASECDEDIGE